MKTSEAGVKLIEAFEGLRLSAYNNDGTPGGGPWTIGYGSTIGVFPGMVITPQQAEDMLIQELSTTEESVNNLVTTTVSQKMYDSLISLCYNIGSGNLSKSSVIRFLNQNLYQQAADSFLLWNKAGGIVVQGLENRRQMERTLFLAGIQDLQNGIINDDPSTDTTPSSPAPVVTPDPSAVTSSVNPPPDPSTFPIDPNSPLDNTDSLNDLSIGDDPTALAPIQNS